MRELNTHLYGVYIGTVEYTKDPAHLGRIQVRVPAVHGDPARHVRPEHLPWASMCQLGGGFYDGGSHLPPPVGSTVLVVFEQGNVDRPFVLGGVPKRPVPKRWVYGDLDTSMGEWIPKDEVTDLPKEVREDREETKHVLFKTPKGASIVVEEKDEVESVTIYDRAGQVFQMVSPVTSTANSGNASQRGLASSIDGSQLPYTSLVNERAIIRTIDLAGQYIEMKAEKDSEVIEISSRKRDPSGPDEQRIVLNNTVGSEEIRIIDRKGQRVVMKNANDDQYILLQSGSARIRIDGSSNRIWIDAGQIDLNQPGPAGE